MKIKSIRKGRSKEGKKKYTGRRISKKRYRRSKEIV